LTQDEIIEMAKKAGFAEGMIISTTGEVLVWDASPKHLERFAKLVAAKEREAIYQLVMEAPFKEFDRQEEDFDGEAATAMKAMAFSLTSAIRARSEATSRGEA
jgi:hypothetical protein